MTSCVRIVVRAPHADHHPTSGRGQILEQLAATLLACHRRLIARKRDSG
ncbi:hypothetical protein [Streptomyces sp. MnatMP-M27]|nr:hypothetical protein [Streptomyces sp. MnatMP-M27]